MMVVGKLNRANLDRACTIFEALSVFVEAGFVPRNRILEFHWYSAEEGGLLGSQAVVKRYLEQKKPVYAVLHSDMTGYQPDGFKPIIAISTDFVSKELSITLQEMSNVYSGLPWKPTKCGYGCSDHASWTQACLNRSNLTRVEFQQHSFSKPCLKTILLSFTLQRTRLLISIFRTWLPLCEL